MLSEASEAPNNNSMNDFKPPKNSFINYESFFGNSPLVIAYNPLITGLYFYQTLKAAPEVYSDIFIPPQNIA